MTCAPRGNILGILPVDFAALGQELETSFVGTWTLRSAVTNGQPHILLFEVLSIQHSEHRAEMCFWFWFRLTC